jgi:hypothetical protein
MQVPTTGELDGTDPIDAPPTGFGTRRACRDLSAP